MHHHQLTPGVCLISLGRVWSILLTGEVCRDEAAGSSMLRLGPTFCSGIVGMLRGMSFCPGVERLSSA